VYKNMLPPSASELIVREKQNDILGNRNKYGGVSNVVEQGRLESQKALMERYRRIDPIGNPDHYQGHRQQPSHAEQL
jgi:hypothetical protein